MSRKQIITALLVIVAVVVGLSLYTRTKTQVSDSTTQPSNADTISTPNDTTPPAEIDTNIETGTETTPVTDEPSAPDGNDVQAFEISYDGKTFTPSKITVKKGDIVTFKNDSDGNFWPASNPDPNHSDYPEFDAKKAIAAGKSWQFKFAKAGTWLFHNHLNATEGGTIVVK